MKELIIVGARIKKARLDKKLTQNEFAELLDLSNNYISSIECGKAIPSLDTFIRICNALEVTADMLLTDSVYKTNEYLKENIALKFDKLSKKNMRIVERFMDILLEENE